MICEWLSSTPTALTKHSVDSDDAVRQRGGQCCWIIGGVGHEVRFSVANHICGQRRPDIRCCCVPCDSQCEIIALLAGAPGEGVCSLLVSSPGLVIGFPREESARDGVTAAAVLPPIPEFDLHAYCEHMCVRLRISHDTNQRPAPKGCLPTHRDRPWL